MKLERLLAIITYLLNHQKVKAQELADKFEVSVRTIYRDVDTISRAGIPVTTFQGADGGIGIVEGYKLDKNLLTSEDVLSILAGLKGLNSINEDIKIKILIEKLSSIANKSDYITTGNEILIDLSSWNKNDKLATLIKDIKRAIHEKRFITFSYYGGTSETVSERKVEPYVIVFKDSHWYLYAFCLLRNDFRLFKIRRMNELAVSDSVFVSRQYSIESVEWDGDIPKGEDKTAVLLFDKCMKYAVSDVFDMDNRKILKNGKIKVSFNLTEESWVYGFILGFGDKVEVVEPPELRGKIRDIAKSIYDKYIK